MNPETGRKTIVWGERGPLEAVLPWAIQRKGRCQWSSLECSASGGLASLEGVPLPLCPGRLITRLLHEWKDTLLVSVVLHSQRCWPYRSSETVRLIVKMQNFHGFSILSMLVTNLFISPSSIPGNSSIHQYTWKTRLWK